MSSLKKPVSPEGLEPLILVIRNLRVILDADLARLYDVPTYRFNEAFKRNRRRFPEDFAFQLTAKEFADLRSHIVTSNVQGLVDSTDTGNSSQIAMSSSPESNSLNRSQFATSSSRHRGATYRPLGLH